MKHSGALSDILNVDNNESLDDTLKNLLLTVRKHLNMDVSFISQFIHNERVFKLVDSEYTTCPINIGDSDPSDETYCKKICDGDLANIIPDTKQNSVTNQLIVTEKLSIGSYIGVPIQLSNGEIYGTFCCYSESNDESLNEKDVSLLNAVSDIAADLIEKSMSANNAHREIEQRIRSIMDASKLSTYYQPIYCLNTQKVAGFESLARFFTEPYRTPDVWFSEANQIGYGELLEMLSVEKALHGLDHFDENRYISINTSPKYILNGAISEVLKHIDPSRIVVEITEHSPIEDYVQFRAVLEPLRRSGLRLAVDDAGAGYASFQHILQLEADIIKLDISLTRNVHLEPKKYLLAKALCAYAKAIDCTIIAEGVETKEELTTLTELGVDKVQGYLLGRPMPLEEAKIFSPDF